MNDIRMSYLMQHDGDALAAAAHLARDLMRGDDETFKQGYTLDNAVLAAEASFGFAVSSRDELRERVRQRALDELEAKRPAVLTRMGRALVEWSGIDPDDADAIERLADAIGFSSIPDAARTVGDSE